MRGIQEEGGAFLLFTASPDLSTEAKGGRKGEPGQGGPASSGISTASRHSLTRSRYSPVRVSTRTRSPTLTKKGTCTDKPVSSRAGLEEPETVSPRRLGDVSTTASSTALGSSTAMGRSS